MLTFPVFASCLKAADDGAPRDDHAFLDDFDRRLSAAGADEKERQIALDSAIHCVLPYRADVAEARRLTGCE